MKQLISNFYSFLMIDNSHEEDDEVFEYQPESAADSIFGKLAIIGIAFVLILQVIA